MKGKLFLIPSTINEDADSRDLPINVIEHINKIQIYIVENIRTSRRFIRKICKEKNIDQTIFYCYGKHNKLNLQEDFLPHILSGNDVGLLSEAGLPCIADPGSKIVAFAHELQIDVIPLVGPSSIFLSLMASGLNAQNFAFIGYLPIERKNRIKQIKKILAHSSKTGQTQIFIETPYRNNQLLEALVKNSSKNTKLCVATNLTSRKEKIITRSISEWKEITIDLHKKPTVFLVNAYTD